MGKSRQLRLSSSKCYCSCCTSSDRWFLWLCIVNRKWARRLSSASSFWKENSRRSSGEHLNRMKSCLRLHTVTHSSFIACVMPLFTSSYSSLCFKMFLVAAFHLFRWRRLTIEASSGSTTVARVLEGYVVMTFKTQLISNEFQMHDIIFWVEIKLSL